MVASSVTTRPNLPHSEGYLSFYPSRGYIRNKWAPEKIQKKTLEALAFAQHKAEATGVMPRDLSNWVLPNTLIENRADYGVNSYVVDKRSPALQAAREMGLSVFERAYGSDWLIRSGLNAVQPDCRMRDQPGYKELSQEQHNKAVDFDFDHMRKAENRGDALAATAFLIGKRNERKTAEAGIKHWNGAGQGAENHLSKVKEMKAMFDDPHNAEVKSFYQQALESAKIPEAPLDCTLPKPEGNEGFLMQMWHRLIQ